jgi:hypothetical protein
MVGYIIISMLATKLLLILAGSILTINGLARIYWEFHSWAVMAQLELRPAVVDGRPHRVTFGIHVVVAAVGVTIFTAAVRWL